eukprot:m.474792 g.474792  ORF g.474792 m.474792 type:complete len:94 (+) comp36914_c0_seq1:192-473(+)
MPAALRLTSTDPSLLTLPSAPVHRGAALNRETVVRVWSPTVLGSCTDSARTVQQSELAFGGGSIVFPLVRSCSPRTLAAARVFCQFSWFGPAH